MFGHKAGAFTGALKETKGLFKAFSAARTVLMDGLGEDFLSGACLACQQHGYIGLRHLAGQGDRLLYGRRFAACWRARCSVIKQALSRVL